MTLFSIKKKKKDFILFLICFQFLYCTQIADDMKPSPIVISILTRLSTIIPTWKIIPGQDIIDLAFKEPEIREQVYISCFCFYFL